MIGMALVHCILGKFLGAVCHCFPPFKVYPRIIILYSVIPDCHCQNILGAKLTKQLFVVVMADQI